MNPFSKVALGLLAGVVALAVVGLGVTAALASSVWPSALLGIPAGLVAGVATAAMTYLWLTSREERASAGRASARTVRRLRATTAAVAGFVLGGGLATAVLATQAAGLATALLTGGLPVGLLTATLAAVLVSRSVRRREGGVRPV